MMQGNQLFKILSLVMFLFTLFCCLADSVRAQNNGKTAQLPGIYEKTSNFLNLISNHEEKKAKSKLLDRIETARKSGKFDVQSHYMMALIDYANYDCVKALNWLDKIEKYNNTAKSITQEDWLNFYWRKAKIYYRDRKYKKAEEFLKKALMNCANNQYYRSQKISMLDLLVGTLAREKKYKESAKYCDQLIYLSCEKAAGDDPLYATTYMWSRLQQVQLYEEAGLKAQAQKASTESLAVLDSLIELRNSYEKTGNWPLPKNELNKQLEKYFKDFHPRNWVDYFWLAVDYEPKSMPVVGWKNDNPRAAIICIHGWGLENRAFTPFGHYMANEGFAVYALDVRGYGAWQAVKGDEDTIYDATLGDIGTLASIIDKKYPNIPIFVLGESMGGAVALRAAAKYDGVIEGVIASVPSAKRYGNFSMSLKTVANALKGGMHKPFDAGTTVSAQATSDGSLLNLWHKDPKGRMKMTPKELINFDKFMRGTIRKCKNIKKTPVLVVQGLADRLVKPKGTFNLYKEVANPNKVLIVDGAAEHLIFESENQNSVLLAGVSAWISKCCTTPSPPPSSSKK